MTEVAGATPKLCKDCIWARRRSFFTRWVCTHDTAIRRVSNRLVTGRTGLNTYFDCDLQRNHECGPQGRYWEPIGMTGHFTSAPHALAAPRPYATKIAAVMAYARRLFAR